MRQGITRSSIIDFADYITANTQNFTGREWVFTAINDWLANPASERFFLLTGEPGSGKTAIASRLTEFSQGITPSPAGLTHLSPGFLSAIHFCSARDSRWITPHAFCESLALQLATHYSTYAAFLQGKSGNRQVHIQVSQIIDQGTENIGVFINNLVLSEILPEDAFNRFVREPLEALVKQNPSQQVVLLVDALDESLSYSGNTNITSLLAHLNHLPPQIRFLLTSRNDERVKNSFLDAEELALGDATFAQQNQDDLRRYVHWRLHSDTVLETQVAQMSHRNINTIAEMITLKAEGNFLYVRFLLDEIASGKRSFTQLEGLPEGLDGLYFESLQRITKLRKRDWSREYAPLLGMLSVTQEALSFAQLQAFTEQSATSVWQYLGDLQQFVKETEPSKGKTEHGMRYRLYHQSFIDFLCRPSLIVKGRSLHNSFYLLTEECHRILADRCEKGNLSNIWDDVQYNPVEQGRREYARAHYLTHLYLAREWPRLFAILDDKSYGQHKIRVFDPSTRAYAFDLDLGRRAATWEGWTFQEGIAYLPTLWRYTLLRGSLRSRADQYPLETFRLLLTLEQEKEVIGLADLITNPSLKINVLLELADTLVTNSQRVSEGKHLFLLVWEIARSIGKSYEKAEALRNVAKMFARHKEIQTNIVWQEAEVAAYNIEEDFAKVEALRELGLALAEAQRDEQADVVWLKAEETTRRMWESIMKDWMLRRLTEALAKAQRLDWAETIARSIQYTAQQAGALGILARELFGTQQKERAEVLWQEADAIACSIEESNHQAEVMCTLTEGLLKAQRWEQAEAIAYAITRNEDRARALRELAEALTRVHQGEKAEAIWQDAIDTAHTIEQRPQQDEALRELTQTLADVRRWDQAEVVAYSIQNGYQQAWALSLLATALLTNAQRDRAQHLYNQVERVINTIKWDRAEVQALQELAEAITHTQGPEQAEDIWLEAERVARSIEERNQKNQALQELARALARVQRWKQTEVIAHTIENKEQRDDALRVLSEGLTNAQCWKQAEKVAQSIEQNEVKVGALLLIAGALTKAQHEEQAETIWQKVEELVYALEPNEQKAGMLRELAEALTQAQYWSKAESAWQEAEKAARALEEGEQKAAMLRILVEILVKVQRWKQAEEIARSIAQGVQRAGALHLLAEALDKAQQREYANTIRQEAEETALSIVDSFQRAEALRDLAVALDQVQRQEQANVIWREAEGAARSVEFPYRKAGALCMVARSLVKAQHEDQAVALLQEAKEIAHTLGDNYSETMVLSQLITEFSQMQRWDLAEEMAHSIKDSFIKDVILNNLAQEIAQRQRWEQLGDMTRSFGQDILSAEVHKSRVTTLLQQNDYKGALRIVQQVWLQAQSKEESLRVFSLALGLTAFSPEIGSPMYEAFKWVHASLSDV